MNDEHIRRRALIVWDALERAADHLPPHHPAELAIQRALRAAATYWRDLSPRSPVAEDTSATPPRKRQG